MKKNTRDDSANGETSLQEHLGTWKGARVLLRLYRLSEMSKEQTADFLREVSSAKRLKKGQKSGARPGAEPRASGSHAAPAREPVLHAHPRPAAARRPSRDRLGARQGLLSWPLLEYPNGCFYLLVSLTIHQKINQAFTTPPPFFLTWLIVR